jgi:hypothetical protein
MYSQNKLYGLWKGVDQEDVGFLSFNEKGFAMLSINNETLGGENFAVNGINAKLTYLVNYSTNPIGLDLILTRLDSNKEVGRLLGIIEFIEDNKLKLRINFDSPTRPANFMPNDNDDSIILERKEMKNHEQ